MTVNRQECCHVAGDIDFDRHNNLWLVTGDDNPAGGINGQGYSPSNDQLTDEQQTVRVANATGGTFTLSFNGQTTAALPFNATATQVDTALEALSSIGANGVQVTGGPVNGAANTTVYFRRALQQADQPLMTGDGAGLTGGTPAIATAQEGGWFQRPTGDARRSALNTNDLRGKVLRIKVKDGDIAPGEANALGGAYTVPAGNLFAPGTAKTRPEVYAMGFRNPFRIQVDENDIAYVSDYSPDADDPRRSRGPAGVGRYMIVRQPSNYGWPTCFKKDLGYYTWSFHEWPASAGSRRPRTTPTGRACRSPTRRSITSATGRRSATTRAGTSRAGPPTTPASRWCRSRSPTRRSGTRTSTTTSRTARSGRRASATTRRLRGRSRPARRPSARGCSRSCSTTASGRTAWPSTPTTRTTRTRRSSRRTTTAR